jgi:hypothetical protein
MKGRGKPRKNHGERTRVGVCVRGFAPLAALRAIRGVEP